MSPRRFLLTAVLLTGSCICGSFAALYAQDTHGGLKTPENISQVTEYDEQDGTYSIGSKLGDRYLEVPTVMTPDEYNRWVMHRSMQSFFLEKYEEEMKEESENRFDFTDMQFDLGPAEKIFGPGGVQIKTSGSATVKLGFDHSRVDNPSLSVQNRKTGGFDFDEQINQNATTKRGRSLTMTTRIRRCAMHGNI